MIKHDGVIDRTFQFFSDPLISRSHSIGKQNKWPKGAFLRSRGASKVNGDVPFSVSFSDLCGIGPL